MHGLDVILTLTGCLGVALVAGYVTHRLGLSPMVGYLLAGIAVGPYTPGFVAEPLVAEQFAEIGVVLLMFGVGLNFHLDELLAVRRVAIPGAVVQSVVATGLTAVIVRCYGWPWDAGIVFGMAISVASTVVLVRVLADHNDLHTRTGHVAVGWLVVEDLFTVVVLVLLPALFGRERESAAGVGLAVGVAALKIGGFVVVTVLVGRRAIPWLLERVARTRSRELFTLTILVVALGIAAGSATLFGVSMALGAFLAGMIVGRSEFSLRAASEALPMRDAFAVLFFVSVGMLFDPRHLIEAPGLTAATLGVVVLGKPVIAFAVVLLLRQPPKVGLGVSVALAQIGEFSFMLALLGRQLGVLPPAATATLVAAAIVSIMLNPLLYRAIDPLAAKASRRSALWRWLELRAHSSRAVAMADPRPDGDAAPPMGDHRAIVVGYGPVGRTVTRLLAANEIRPTVVELNVDTVRELRKQGIAAVYGDAAQHETLQSAGVASAGSLILSSSATQGCAEIIRLARELNPEIRVLARTTYARDLPALRRAGAAAVVSSESEVALSLTVAILEQLGATPEQIDRERARVQSERLAANDGSPPARA